MSSQRERQRERSQSAQSGNTENVRQHAHTRTHTTKLQTLTTEAATGNKLVGSRATADMLSHTHTKCFTMLFKTYFGGSFRNTGFRINNPIICMWVMCVWGGRVKPTVESERDIEIDI